MSALAPGGPAGSATRFREAREADWTRLEQLLDRIEKGKAGSLSDEDLFELPVLYRATLSSLSVARETSLDVDLVAYLESLSTRAYFILYGVHAPFLGRLAKFFGRDWPLSVRSIWRETKARLTSVRRRVWAGGSRLRSENFSVRSKSATCGLGAGRPISSRVAT